MTTALKQQTMNLDQIKNDLINAAQAKLRAHSQMGSNSRLSIMEVAQLRDIIAGNVELKVNQSAQFFGLHSLN
ncbi:MAG: hypothetical protein IPH24_01535 [Crocinitomicaceae bacterium]|jgi:hypothetical protein|nr:hypothetical protein [Crocinitomicaceae bacterium]